MADTMRPAGMPTAPRHGRLRPSAYPAFLGLADPPWRFNAVCWMDPPPSVAAGHQGRWHWRYPKQTAGMCLSPPRTEATLQGHGTGRARAENDGTGKGRGDSRRGGAHMGAA